MTNKKRRITIGDVAEKAGVSITTVSRFLNQQYGAMREETKTRIQEVIEELDYHPNKFAQGLKQNRSRTIAVVVVNLGYPFCVSVIRSLSESLRHSGYSLMVAETGGDKQQEEKILRTVMAQPVDGVVIQTNGQNNVLLESMARQIPVVLVDRQFDVAGAANIITDNAGASEQLTKSLFVNGYKRILYVTEHIQDISTRTDRLLGYETACLQFGVQPWVAWVNRAQPDTLDAVIEIVRNSDVLDHTEKPFAVYSANGLIMLDLYPLLRELSYAVPEEMGIATFDEPDWAQVATPSLTCVRQPTDDIGRRAADVIVKLLRKRPDGAPQNQTRIVLPSQVIPGGSTALAPATLR